MSLNALLISPAILKDRMVIHTNIDEKLLYPEIKLAQDMYIHPLLGTALYDRIVGEINVSGTVFSTDYKALLDNYIIDTLCYYVMAELPQGISFQFWNKGVIRKVGDSTELPDMNDLLVIASKYRNRAEWYGERLSRYLKQNASNTFLPEYQSPGNGIDTLIPAVSAFTMPIYLGGEYCPSLDMDNCNCDRQNQIDLNP